MAKRFHCHTCKKKTGRTFAWLTGGALGEGAVIDKITDELEGYLGFGVHGAHPEGLPTEPNANVKVITARQGAGDQFELGFCSTACLRKFLNSVVDDLEKKLRKEAVLYLKEYCKLGDKKLYKQALKKVSGIRKKGRGRR